MQLSLSGHLLGPMPWEEAAAAGAGITLSQLRFTLSFFLSVAAGWTLRYVPTVKGRHAFSAVTGFLLLWYPFGNGVFHALVTSALTYLLMARFPQHCGTLAWLAVFPYLIMCHVMSASGMAWKEGKMDFTGAQMVATLKLIAVAMCYQDGFARKASAKKSDDVKADDGKPAGTSSTTGALAADGESRESPGPKADKPGPAATAAAAAHHAHPRYHYASAKALGTLPSLLEFLSYVFAAGNLLAGPFFEAKDYFDYVERKGDWDQRNPDKRLPSPIVPGLVRLFKGIFYAALWAKLAPVYNPELLESKWFNSIPLWQRMGLFWVVGFSARCKYYFAWAVAESQLIFSGLCFEGYTHGPEGKRKPRWTRYINSRIRKVEFCTSSAALAANWNVCTGTWLRHYVYERLAPPGKRPTFRSMVVTQTISGIWHGLFPGYWLFFVSTAFMLEASKVLYRYEQSWSPRLRHFPLWTLAKLLYTAYILNYCASAFLILSFKESISVWSSVYFSGHFLMIAILAVGAALPPSKPRVNPRRASEAGPQLQAAKGAAVAAAAGAGEGKTAGSEGADAGNSSGEGAEKAGKAE